MPPIFSLSDNILTDDELAALTAVITQAQTQLEFEDAYQASTPLRSPVLGVAFGPASAAGNVTYY